MPRVIRAGGNLTFENPVIQQMFDLWTLKAASGHLPCRKDFDPIEMPELLPWLFLIDVVPQDTGIRFRYRLVGTMYVEVLGRNYTGQWLEDALPDASRDTIIQSYHDVLKAREPLHRVSRATFKDKRHMSYERLACPLANDGENIDMIIGVIQFGSLDPEIEYDIDKYILD